MDASAFISADEWKSLLERLRLDEDRICEGRYDHVVHMVFVSFRLIISIDVWNMKNIMAFYQLILKFNNKTVDF